MFDAHDEALEDSARLAVDRAIELCMLHGLSGERQFRDPVHLSSIRPRQFVTASPSVSRPASILDLEPLHGASSTPRLRRSWRLPGRVSVCQTHGGLATCQVEPTG
jgi:hypothetical protein